MVKSLGKSNIKSNDLSKRKRLDYEDSASDAEPESSFRGKLDDYEALRLPNSDEEEEDSEEGDAFEEDEYYSDVDSDMDGDAPRAVAWQDDEDPETLQEGSSDEDEDSEPGPNSKIDRLQEEMASLPFGTLLEAKAEAEAEESSDDSDSSDDSASEGEGNPDPGTDDEKPKDWKLAADRKAVPKRMDKNAPVALTSKKPVSRFRQVVETKKLEVRDPRFSSLSGDFDEVKFAKRYSFLTDMQKQEASTLRKELREAKKALEQTDGPTWRVEKRVQDLRRTLNRTEGMIKRNRQETREREIISKAKKEEREKQSQGKKAWHMKESDKRKLLLEAKFSEIASQGGQRGVKKFMEKKQKKIAQQEKRSRPYAKGEFFGSGDGPASGPVDGPQRGDNGRRGRRTMREGGRAMQAPMTGGMSGRGGAGRPPKRPRFD